jgi:MerR family transcriptional regulator, copper efflux regulator
MKVHELAEKSGLTAHTIRFYEKEGLLDSRHVRRDANNYRNYTETAIERLGFIKKFQGIGCSIAELKEVLHDKDVHARTNREVISWIRQKIAEVERKKEENDLILATLNRMLEYRTKSGRNRRRGPTTRGRLPR